MGAAESAGTTYDCSGPIHKQDELACTAVGGSYSCTEDCFPGSSSVELESGETVTMDKLQVGDRVRVNANEFAPIFMFTHVEKDTKVEYFQLTTQTGKPPSISAGHLVEANPTLLAAREVEVGHTV